MSAFIATTCLWQVGCGTAHDRCDDLPKGEAIAAPQGDVVISSPVVDEDSVYWLDSDNGRIYRTPREGGDSEVLVENESYPSELIGDDSSIFWVAGDRSVRRADKGNWVPRTVYAGSSCTDAAGCKAALTGDSAALYFYEGSTNRILRLDKAGDAVVELGQSLQAPLASDGTYLYWTKVVPGSDLLPVNLEVHRVQVVGGAEQVVVDLGDYIPEQVYASASHVIVGVVNRDSGAAGIFDVPLAGGEPVLVSGQARRFSVDGDSVFFAAEAAVMIQASLADKTQIILGCASEEPTDIVASSTTLYWSERWRLLALPR